MRSAARAILHVAPRELNPGQQAADTRDWASALAVNADAFGAFAAELAAEWPY
jgi:hypothetical protein